MTKREPFAKQVISSCPPSHIAEGLKSATGPWAEDVRMGGCACGSCIDAAFESAVAERVKEKVEEFREMAIGAMHHEMFNGGTWTESDIAYNRGIGDAILVVRALMKEPEEK